ncbi:MAG TPA: hypothetical protein VEI07_19140, partial [Planctomycetaceae bacterium]|nr:hypothetical protein [Planctomycetaceae bacterium]
RLAGVRRCGKTAGADVMRVGVRRFGGTVLAATPRRSGAGADAMRGEGKGGPRRPGAGGSKVRKSNVQGLDSPGVCDFGLWTLD